MDLTKTCECKPRQYTWRRVGDAPLCGQCFRPLQRRKGQRSGFASLHKVLGID